MKEICLSQNKAALVDDADYDWLNQWKWCLWQYNHISYAVRKIAVSKNKQRFEHMHRVILGFRPGDRQHTDHIDGNGLNNQRANLRRCTRTQNLQSQRKWKAGASGYKGITWNRSHRKWYSRISRNGKRVFLGSFDSEADAAQAYDAAALKHFGEFALTNEMLGLR